MKKTGIAIVILLVAVFVCSCSSKRNNAFGNNNSERVEANQKMEKVLQALENEDADGLTSLFSANVIAEDDSFNEKLDLLFEYYNGALVSYNDWGAPAVYNSVDSEGYNRRVTSYDMTYDVETTEEKYRFAIYYVVLDTADVKNVGIQSLYIIKAQDDTNLQFPYWGDGKNTPGINIDVKNDIREE